MKKECPYSVNQFSIIVTANQNNPTILNPDFLVTNNIVSKTMKVSETVTSPVFSSVKYDLIKSGLSNRVGNLVINVEPQKITIAEASGNDFREDYLAPKVMDKYIQTLNHVPYTGLGINWQIFFPVESPEKWLNDKFINIDAFHEDIDTMKAASIKLSSVFDKAQCIISLDSATSVRNNKEEQGIVVTANFHHTPANKIFVDGDIKKIIKTWPALQKNLQATLKKLIVEN